MDSMLSNIRTGKKDYRIIREVLTGKANDVYVCQDYKEPTAPFKTMWVVKDRKIAKALMGSLENSCEELFMHNENAGFVFPYFHERPLHKFYLINIQNAVCIRQQIWLGLVVKCMTSGLPDAVLNLILNQGQIHLEPDGTICFGYFVDLSQYNDSVCEKENVADCAKTIYELICLESVEQKVTVISRQAYMLLEKKMGREEYNEFMQLYSDMKLISKMNESGDKRIVVSKIIAEMKNVAMSKQNSIYRLLSCTCVVLVSMAVFVFAGYLLFGEFSFWKLFGGSLDTIGTESLLR